jgi:hypothetical protein
VQPPPAMPPCANLRCSQRLAGERRSPVDVRGELPGLQLLQGGGRVLQHQRLGVPVGDA